MPRIQPADLAQPPADTAPLRHGPKENLSRVPHIFAKSVFDRYGLATDQALAAAKATGLNEQQALEIIAASA